MAEYPSLHAYWQRNIAYTLFLLKLDGYPTYGIVWVWGVVWSKNNNWLPNTPYLWRVEVCIVPAIVFHAPYSIWYKPFYY